MSRRNRCLALGAAAIVLGGCGDTTAPPPPAPGVLPIEFRNAIGNDVYGDGAYLGSAVWVQGSTLRAVVSTPRSCSLHGLSVVAPRRFTPSHPPTLDLYLRHVASADSCAGDFADTVAVDLGPAIQLHNAEFPAEDPWSIRLASKDSGFPSHYAFDFVRIPPRASPPGSESRDVEAEDLALWLADSVTTPDVLYATLRGEMASIRSQFGNRFPDLPGIRFVPPKNGNGLVLVLDAAAADAALKDEYRAWDPLNDSLGLVRVDSYDLGARYFDLTYQRRAHPSESTAGFFRLPGVLCAHASSVSSSWHVYPRTVGGGRSFLFQGGWGDCPSGCITRHYIYLEPQGGGFALAGDWTTDAAHPDPPPWWPEAQKNVDLYASWRGCCSRGSCPPNLDDFSRYRVPAAWRIP